MGQESRSKDELVKELEAALLRVDLLEGLLLDGATGETVRATSEASKIPRHHNSQRVEFFESTQTLDLTGLVFDGVGSPGNYYLRGSKRTQFGRLMEALPTPALLLSGSRDVILANQAWGKISADYEKIVGRPLSELFPIPSTAKDVDLVAARVFATREIACTEAILAIGDKRVWGRITIRSVRLGPKRFLLALAEDLTSEKKRSFSRQKRQDKLRREIERRIEIEQALRASQQRLELALAGADSSSCILTRGKVAERDEQGKPLRALETNLDIAQAKQFEEKIQVLAQTTIQALEQERKRISLDLHDEVAQDLVALRLTFQTMVDDVADANPELKSTLTKASERLRELVKTIRGISYSLRPAGLDKLGLVSAVRQYCRDFEAKNSIRVKFLTSGAENPRLDSDTEINLFRVIQESLTNIRNHSGATRARIVLKVIQNVIVLSIRDNGKGFDVERESVACLKGEKMGLWCMKQRIGLLHGKLTIKSNPRTGTEILVQVPHRSDENAPQGKNTDRG